MPQRPPVEQRGLHQWTRESCVPVAQHAKDRPLARRQSLACRTSVDGHARTFALVRADRRGRQLERQMLVQPRQPLAQVGGARERRRPPRLYGRRDDRVPRDGAVGIDKQEAYRPVDGRIAVPAHRSRDSLRPARCGCGRGARGFSRVAAVLWWSASDVRRARERPDDLERLCLPPHRPAVRRKRFGHALETFTKPRGYRFFDGVARDERHGVHASSLSEPVDASYALLEPQRRPGHFEVDNEPAAMMKVQSFAGRVGCQQQRSAAARESAELRRTFRRTQAAVQACCRCCAAHIASVERACKPLECVAILREHDRSLTRAPQEASDRGDLGLVRFGGAGQDEQPLQPSAFSAGVREARRGKLGPRLLVVTRGHLVQRKGELDLGWRGGVFEQGHPPLDRSGERGRAGARPPRQYVHSKVRRGSRGFRRIAPHMPDVGGERCVHPALRLRGTNPKQTDSTRRLHAGVRAGAAKEQDVVAVVELSERAKALEGSRVAGVRRGGEHGHAAAARGDLSRCRRPIRPAAQPVHFVEHDEVPHERFERADDVGALHEVD